MKKFQHAKTVSKLVTAALAAAFVFMSATPALAAEKTVSDLQDIIYQNEESDGSVVNPKAKAVVASDGVVEYHCDVEDLNMDGMQIISEPLQPGDSMRAPNTFYYMDWTINPNTRHVSHEYKISNGQVVMVSSAVSPTDKDYWLGIMDDDGHARYVEGRSIAAHNFVITTTNMYCVFIQNNYRNVTLTSRGSFAYDTYK